MSSVMEAIQDRRLDHPGVVAKLDRMTEGEVFGVLGNCREVRRYAEASPIRREDGTVGPAWMVGDGRPTLANEDPAVIAAMNHCAAARIRFPQAVRAVTENHPTRCGWCESVPDGSGTKPAFPLEELLLAIAHGLYFARLVGTHLLIWDGEGGSTYIRSGPEDGRYQHQEWAAFAALPAAEQKRRVAAVLDAVREGVAA